MASNQFCEPPEPPPDTGTVFSSLSSIDDAVSNIPTPFGGGGEDEYGDTAVSGVSSGTYINAIDMMAGMSNFFADNTWKGGADEKGGQYWSVSDVSSAGNGGVFGKIRASTASGFDAVVDAVRNSSVSANENDVSAYQVTQLQQAVVGTDSSGLNGIYATNDSIKTNTATLVAGTKIKASDGTTLGATSNALDVHVAGGDSGGLPINVAPGPQSHSLSVSGDGPNGAIAIETYDGKALLVSGTGAGGAVEMAATSNLPVNIAAVGVGLGVYNSQALGLQVTNGSGGALGVSAFEFASSVLIDEDASGDNPQTNTTVIAAPGAGYRIVIEGYTLTMAGSASTAYGEFLFTDGNAGGSLATGSTGVVIAGRMQGATTTSLCSNAFTPIGLAENAALKLSTTEGSGNLFLFGSIQFRIVPL
tara:strand:- start:8304 stop:9557 length:1254 start_codon:yes stop_codon:yes gene_type:complete